MFTYSLIEDKVNLQNPLTKHNILKIVNDNISCVIKDALFIVHVTIYHLSIDSLSIAA